METIITSHTVSSLNLKSPSLKSKFNPSSLFQHGPKLTSFQPSVRLQHSFNDELRLCSHRGLVRASSAGQSNATDDDEDRWLLEPVGDGDSRHIGFKVAMPTAFEITSNVVTVGRVPEKADIVIPVATVSGTHARFQKQGGTLLVTDLDSTNGTFIDEKRLTPGVPAIVPPGRYITFGAIFIPTDYS
ncbi:putative zeaxanthin epoxidase [Helianthus annuus]|nr:putative zeaxanthin epoxidase [Helianthus annuus]KAJ0775170.1 putative zeaxanthin epoxidase [Helianthus annuus]